jgi:D-glycerate 3-kinase
MKTLNSLQARQPTSVPVYDKSQFAGAGDRADPSTWPKVEEGLDVVILEGWCVGFQALEDEELKAQWASARDLEAAGKGTGQLGKLKYEDVLFVNDALWEYGAVWERFDAFVHVDAKEPEYVYEWRLEAEVKMRERKGAENAMTDEQVRRFVDGCELSFFFTWRDVGG